MTPKKRKQIWWALIAGGAGAFLFFAIICILEGPPPPRAMLFYLWPVSAGGIAILSYFKLRRCYHDEPMGSDGFWHLSIADFYATTIFTALALGSFRAIWPNEFVPGGAIACVLAGSGFLAGILIATRMGIRSALMKYLYAFGMVQRTAGFMALGLLVIAGVVGMIAKGNLRSLWYFLVELFAPVGSPQPWGFTMLRIGVFIFLPAGIIIGKFVDAQREKSHEPPAS